MAGGSRILRKRMAEHTPREPRRQVGSWQSEVTSGFWLLASGFWLLASGFWLQKKKPRTTLMPCRNSRLVFPGLILSFSPLTPCENETLTTAIPECRIFKQSRHHITAMQAQGFRVQRAAENSEFRSRPYSSTYLFADSLQPKSCCMPLRMSFTHAFRLGQRANARSIAVLNCSGS